MSSGLSVFTPLMLLEVEIKKREMAGKTPLSTTVTVKQSSEALSLSIINFGTSRLKSGSAKNRPPKLLSNDLSNGRCSVLLLS